MNRSKTLCLVILVSLLSAGTVSAGFWENLVTGILHGLHNLAFNQRIRMDLQRADQQLANYDTYAASRTIRGTIGFLRYSNDYQYNRLAGQLEAVDQDIIANRVYQAQARISYILNHLPTASTPAPSNGDSYFYRSIRSGLQRALTDLRRYRPDAANRTLYSIDRLLMPRWSTFDRQLRSGVGRVINLVRQRRYPLAIGQLQTLIRNVNDQLSVGPNDPYNPYDPYNPHDPQDEIQNHREWIRDIRDLIDTLQDGDLRMARRDLQTLIRDVRQDGAPSSFNRSIERRLRFIAQRLQQYYPDIRDVVYQLRGVQDELRRSLHH